MCPLPVLAASLMCGLWAAGLLSMGLYGWPMPVFGRMVSGAAGAAISLGMLLLLGYAAWGIVRLQRLAWWCAVVAVLVWGVSWFLLLMGPGLMPFYETMGMGEQQLAGIRQMVVALGPQMAWLSGCWLVALLGYLFYIRRFFPKPETA